MSLRTIIKTGGLASAAAVGGGAASLGGVAVSAVPFSLWLEVVIISSACCLLTAAMFLFPFVRRTHLLDAATSELYRLSRTDFLTGIANRRSLYERAEGCFRSGKPRPAVLVIDIDHFKSLNDRFGHAVGDEVLVKVSETISAVVSEAAGVHAIVGRTGGEEFAVVVPDCSTDRASQLANALCNAVAAQVLWIDCVPLTVTVSIGVTFPSEVSDLDSALLLADKATYAAQKGGRNRWMWAPGIKPVRKLDAQID